MNKNYKKYTEFILQKVSRCQVDDVKCQKSKKIISDVNSSRNSKKNFLGATIAPRQMRLT